MQLTLHTLKRPLPSFAKQWQCLPRDIVTQKLHTINAWPSPKVTDCGESARGASIEEGPATAAELGRPRAGTDKKTQREAGREKADRGPATTHRTAAKRYEQTAFGDGQTKGHA